MPKGIYTRTDFHIESIRNGVKKRRPLNGAENPAWCGGRSIHSSGYIRIRKTEHPNTVDGYILEHRFIMEQKLNRFLNKQECVHHINGIKDDNRSENLMLFNSNSEHKKYETPRGNSNHKWKGGKPACLTCGTKISYGARSCKKHRPIKHDGKGKFIWHSE